MKTNNYIEKGNRLILCQATQQPFYATPAPSTIKPEYFDVAEAIWSLMKTLEAMEDIGDVLTPKQVEGINAAYAEFCNGIIARAEAATKAAKRGAK